MSSGQSDRNGSSVEPGLPKTFLMPKARSRSKVACLTVVALVALAGLRDDIENSKALSFYSVIARSDATKQSIPHPLSYGLLRFARNDGERAVTTSPSPSS